MLYCIRRLEVLEGAGVRKREVNVSLNEKFKSKVFVKTFAGSYLPQHFLTWL
jgi:hypothetical protein